MTRPKIMLMGSGSGLYREYLLASVAREYRVVLVQEEPVTWEGPYLHSAHPVSVTDMPAILGVADSEGIDGVLTWVEPCVEAAAFAAMLLEVPGNTPQAAAASRDKHRMRQVWAQESVPSARSILVRTADEAERAAKEIGYPVVVKPRALAASVGVTLARDERELAAAFTVAAGSDMGFGQAVGDVLVEEYLDGPEVSVESVVHEGEVHIVAVTAKRIGLPPGFEELGHLVSADAQAEAIGLVRDTVLGAHRAIGLTVGVTHAELRLTAAGPKMVEIAARLGGDFIPRLVHLATGVDLGLAAADVCVGREPDVGHSRAASAGVVFRYPERSGMIAALAEITPPPGVVEARWTAEVGTGVGLPPDHFVGRMGHAIAVADDAGTCEEVLRQVSEGMRAEVRPLAPGETISPSAQGAG
ncbi:ATP-grasp domain-containing protein [Rhizohabitans arisaemae]|uniref:ATP-grasp domain-containing protein n=1 Tax=Rhizohabitans arisaemae TaxID=2720610 RepID=UPI0024B24448|nr:ATP-grasp domain-containing protein [Rhizohabitans arisaemae]